MPISLLLFLALWGALVTLLLLAIGVAKLLKIRSADNVVSLARKDRERAERSED